MTTAQRLSEAELDASIRSTQEPQRTPEQVRSDWLEVLPDTDAEDDLLYGIASGPHRIIYAILAAVVVYIILVATGALDDLPAGLR